MMETLGFGDKDARDACWRTWQSEGSEGLARYSTHIDGSPTITYVVTRRAPAVVSQNETLPDAVHAAPGTEVPLTDPAASDMLSEGGNSDDVTEPVQLGEDGQRTDITPGGTPPLVPAV
jgi:hypothetical protein